eukprot:m.184272 g.184272  ORF g.184272 m.184272 type:complete len:1168 (-) comp15557_c1_seq4:1905-5408(-)
MPEYTLRGVTVDFPYEAYNCQLAYMEKVLEALQNGHHAALESPTGTGKTLCLLCASLAWIKTIKANDSAPLKKDVKQEGDKSHATPTWETSNKRVIPKILYASRTHSQLSQTIKELKCTSYNANVSVLGSRDQLCINKSVQELGQGSRKSVVCQQKVKARSCGFHNNYLFNRNTVTLGNMDIEDLVSYGQEHRMCPYFLARSNFDKAELIVLPYNYLFDSVARRAQGITINGNIIIFDEAHNIQSNCQEASSFEFGPSDIAGCTHDIDRLVTMYSEDSNETMDLIGIKKTLLDFEGCLQTINFGGEKHKSFDGNYIYQLLQNAKITTQNATEVIATLDAAISKLLGDTPNSHCYLSKFQEILQVLFCDRMKKRDFVDQNFRVLIKDYEPKQKKPKKASTWEANPVQDKYEGKRVLCFWCFSSELALQELHNFGAHSIIFTSGTLSPMQTFLTELGIKVPVTLENEHVIKPHQLWVGVLCNGVSGKQLSSEFRTRNDIDYQKDLGNTIINFARTVPDGVLVFFASYSAMRACIQCWQTQTGNGRNIWDRIKQHKAPIVEPTGKHEFLAAMHDFYEKIRDPGHSGAIFFAVCRGKVSEGLDFADRNGRAVIIAGMPFPPFYDQRVILKKDYLDKAYKNNNHTGMTGDEWYSKQSSVAVNQAIGRVIRHIGDYGAIIFCDYRFKRPDTIRQLPKWMRKYVQVYDKFGMVQSNLTRFFRTMDASKELVAKPEVIVTKKIDVTDAVIEFDPKSKQRVPQQQLLRKTPRRHMSIDYDHDCKDDKDDIVEKSSAPRRGLLDALQDKKPSSVLVLNSGMVQEDNVQVEDEPNSGPLHETTNITPDPTKARTVNSLNPFDPSWKATAASTAVGPSDPEVIVVDSDTSSCDKTKKKKLYNREIDSKSEKKPSSVVDTKGGKISGAAYLHRVREALGSAGFKRFTQLLKAFKKDAHQVPERAMMTLVTGFKLLFSPLNTKGDCLAREFQQMLQPKQRKLFEWACSKVNCFVSPGMDDLGGGTPESATRSKHPLDDHSKKSQKRRKHQGSTPNLVEGLPGYKLGSQNQQDTTSNQPIAKYKDSFFGPTPILQETSQKSSVRGDDEKRTPEKDLKEGNLNEKCAKCKKKPMAPFSAPCGHTCCYKCWNSAPKNKEGRLICPNEWCATPIRKSQLQKIYLV